MPVTTLKIIDIEQDWSVYKLELVMEVWTII